MEKRLLLAFILSFGVLYGFRFLYPPPPAAEKAATPVTENQVTPPTPPVSPTPVAPVTPRPGDIGRYHLITGARQSAFMHSQQRNVESLLSLQREPLAEVGETVAREVGLAGGEWIEVVDVDLPFKTGYGLKEKGTDQPFVCVHTG